MSSNNKTRRGQRKKPEREPDLATQYGEIGIKAVAAAANDTAKASGSATGHEEQNKRAKEKASE